MVFKKLDFFSALDTSRPPIILIPYQSFGADAKYRVPTMQNRLGDLICPPSKKSFYYQGFFAVKWRAVFILGAKRTVAPPNAKHSTLLQDCFLCFCFLIPFTIRQQCIIYPPKFSTGPNSCQKSFLLLKKMRFFYIFCRFCWIFSFSCVYLWYLFKVNQPANVPT